MYFLKFSGSVILLSLLLSFSAFAAHGGGPEEDEDSRLTESKVTNLVSNLPMIPPAVPGINEGLEAECASMRQRIKALENEKRELADQNETVTRILAESGAVAKAEQERLNRRLDSLREVNEANYAAASAAERKAVEAESSLNAMRIAKEAKEAEIVAAESALAEARQQITDLIEEQGELAEAKQDLTLRVAALERQLRESQEARETLGAREAAVRRELEESRKTITELRDSLRRGQDAFMDCQSSLAALRAEKERQESAHREDLARLTSLIEQCGEEYRIRLEECQQVLAEEREARRKAELEYRELQQKYCKALMGGVSGNPE
jgi:chromosome segregation ATPase